MLERAARLGCVLRPHVKTAKTLQAATIQTLTHTHTLTFNLTLVLTPTLTLTLTLTLIHCRPPRSRPVARSGAWLFQRWPRPSS